MVKFIRPLIITVLLYCAALVQVGFLPRFAIAGQTPNLVFIIFFILVFFEDDYLFFAAAIGGFLLDIFFFPVIGISIVGLYAVWGLQKANAHFFKKSHESRILAANFVLSFLMSFIFYTILFFVFSLIFHFPFTLSWTFLIAVSYNLIVAYIGFTLFRQLGWAAQEHNQLKLF